jgi:hypothetical protein
MRASVIAFVIGLVASACVPPNAPLLPQGASLVVTADPRGWVHVREPSWFTVDFPKAPESTVVPDKTPEGALFDFKKIGVSTADGLFTVAYVDLGAALSKRAASFIVKRYDEHPEPGLELEPAHDIVIDGSTGRALDGIAEPSSKTNGATFPIDVHARVVVRGERLFQLQCSTPHASAATCDRFFASFRFE